MTKTDSAAEAATTRADTAATVKHDKETLKRVVEHFGEKAVPADAEEEGLRYMLVAWVGLGKHGENEVAGVYTSLEAVKLHDWVNGEPQYAIDLCAPVERAFHGVSFEMHVASAATDATDWLG